MAAEPRTAHDDQQQTGAVRRLGSSSRRVTRKKKQPAWGGSDLCVAFRLEESVNERLRAIGGCCCCCRCDSHAADVREEEEAAGREAKQTEIRRTSAVRTAQCSAQRVAPLMTTAASHSHQCRCSSFSRFCSGWEWPESYGSDCGMDGDEWQWRSASSSSSCCTGKRQQRSLIGVGRRRVDGIGMRSDGLDDSRTSHQTRTDAWHRPVTHPCEGDDR